MKGQLHAHTNRSGDSDTPAAEVHAWYQRRGYDFVVFTDHDRVTDTPDTDLLTVPGIEITQNSRTCEPQPRGGDACLMHVNGLFVEPAVGTSAAPDPPETLERRQVYGYGVDVARSLGALPMLNHPNMQFGADGDVILFLAQKHGLLLMEVLNQASDSRNEGDAAHPSTERLWDTALTGGARIFATAGDDAHHYDDAAAARARGEEVFVGDLGFVVVRSDKTTPAIRAALERGDFYASTGVILSRLELTTESIAIETAGDGGHAFEVIGTGGQLLSRSAGNKLAFDPRSAPPGYVRVKVTGPGGTVALTQPVFRR